MIELALRPEAFLLYDGTNTAEVRRYIETVDEASSGEYTDPRLVSDDDGALTYTYRGVYSETPETFTIRPGDRLKLALISSNPVTYGCGFGLQCAAAGDWPGGYVVVATV